MITEDGQHKSRKVMFCGVIEVSASLDQQMHKFQTAFVSGVHEGGLAVTVKRIDVGTRVEECANSFCIATDG